MAPSQIEAEVFGMALVFFTIHGRLCAVQAVSSAVWHPGQQTEAAKLHEEVQEKQGGGK